MTSPALVKVNLLISSLKLPLILKKDQQNNLVWIGAALAQLELLGLNQELLGENLSRSYETTIIPSFALEI